jgi:hypothetical protein
MGLDTKTYWLTDRQSQCDFDFDFWLSKKRPEYNSKLEEYRRVQDVDLWRLNGWFEDFMYAIVQWYLVRL